MFNEIMKISYVLSAISSILFIFVVAIYSLNVHDSGNLSPMDEENNVNWLEDLIEQEKNNAVVNPPSSVIMCNYNNEVVYHLSARCCGVYGYLYDGNGKVICSPDGGIAERGDGKCVDFFSERINCEVIWKDDRSFAKEVSIN